MTLSITLPLPDIHTFLTWAWSDMQPYFDQLSGQSLDAESLPQWLTNWTALSGLIQEMSSRLRVATVQNTTDAEAEAAFKTYLQEVHPNVQKANQALIQKLLATGLSVPGFELPLKKMEVDAAIFREENLPLEIEESKQAIVFNKITGTQTIEWAGLEYTIPQLTPIYEPAERSTREEIWRLVMAREQADREAINQIWSQSLQLRMQQASNAGFDDYRSYRWQQLKRFDYTPENCKSFHRAIETAVLPAANRVYQRHLTRLSAKSIRPWDLELYQGTYPIYTDTISAFENGDDLETTGSVIFRQVDPRLGGYFDTLRQHRSMDLENRKGKSPGAFCTSYPASRRPFIFMNAVGSSKDVTTLLHESGHAFHNFETYALPYAQQRRANMEFNEVASMAMELLAAPYLTKEHGGFYTPEEVSQARIRHLEKILLFWPYMAVVDAFQHWIYENPTQALDPANCDHTWSDLWARFIPAVDFSGLETFRGTGWHRKRHIHRSPFYYIEYGLAQLGAVQIWANALEDQAAAVAAYLKALSLGGTAALPDLYKTAGANFAFDADTLARAVELIETTIASLETA